MIEHSWLNRYKAFLQGPVVFNIRILYKLDSPWHVSECIPFVFREGTVNVVKIQEVLTESPNLSSTVYFRNKLPVSARVYCIEYVFLRSCFMYLSLGWLLYVQLYTLCLVSGDFTYMSHKQRWFCLKHLWHTLF
jgi:hypothetical protein